MYKLLAICGKAGSGKDTLQKKLIAEYPDKFHGIVSYTSRPRRSNETNGIDYNFISKAEFQNLIENKQVLEYAVFRDWYYGTPTNALQENYVNVGVFNLTGIRQLQKCQDIELKVIYLDVKDRIRLQRQLNRESNPDVEEIIRRKKTDDIDFANIQMEIPDLVTYENNKTQDLEVISVILGNSD